MQPQGKRRQATYEDLLKVPDHLVAEILDGELPALPEEAYFSLAPDGVCEVTSPFTASRIE